MVFLSGDSGRKLEEIGDIQDENDLASPENAAARHPLEAGQRAPQRFDEELLLADEAVDHNPHLAPLHLADEYLNQPSMSRDEGLSENPAEAEQRHRFVVQTKYLLLSLAGDRLPPEFQGPLDAGHRNGDGDPAGSDQQDVDDGDGEGEPEDETAAMPRLRLDGQGATQCLDRGLDSIHPDSASG